MENALTATVALAGLFFSLTCALLLEELLFGLVFRLMTCSKRIAAAVQRKQALAQITVGVGEASSSRKGLVI